MQITPLYLCSCSFMGFFLGVDISNSVANLFILDMPLIILNSRSVTQQERNARLFSCDVSENNHQLNFIERRKSFSGFKFYKWSHLIAPTTVGSELLRSGSNNEEDHLPPHPPLGLQLHSLCQRTPIPSI